MDFVQQLLVQWGWDQSPLWTFLAGVAFLLVAGEGVVLVLNTLEKHDFGSAHLGALFTPLCTGFPNLMLGIFGGTRLSGDLVLHLNIGNNVANATLVVGLLIFLCGPLVVRTGSSRADSKQYFNFTLALIFLWAGALLTFFTAKDGRISRLDGAALLAVYLIFQAMLFIRRGKPPKRKRLKKTTGALCLLGLIGAALLIAFSIEAISLGLSAFQAQIPGATLGMFLGLLTVLPESFLLLRLARRNGNLGLSGLVGDCLVSIPLVIGVATLIRPVDTAAVTSAALPSAIPYWGLALAMSCLSLLALREKPLPRYLGLILMGLYLFIWWLTSGM